MKQSLLLSILLFLWESALAIPAFPGAQGGGATSVGGRGGAVIEVTTTAGSGPGSLRACIDTSGPRTCVFRKGGTIEYGSPISITKPFLTIAGQTAPGGGIQLRGDKGTQEAVNMLDTNDIIIRYIRIRKGFNAASSGQSGTNIRSARSNRIMLDHLTTQWNQDEGVADVGTSNWTLSYSITAEAVGESNQAHSTSIGMLAKDPPIQVKMVNQDFHHNLTMNNNNRNPLLRNRSGRLVNNLWYNLGSGMQLSGSTSIDIIGNKWKGGPWAGVSPSFEEVGAFIGHAVRSEPGPPSIRMVGNIGWNQSNPNGDQFLMTNRIGSETGGDQGALPTAWRRSAALPTLPHPIIEQPVTQIEEDILNIVGAGRRLGCDGNWIANRDAQENKLINQYRNGTGPSGQTNGPEIGWGGGGYPTLAAGVPCPDADRDGMPNEWETARGLNPNNAADRNGVQPSGFTNLEVYLAGSGGTEPPDPPLPQPPSVSITEPPNGATVRGSAVTVSADAADDAAVLGVQFRLDGVNLGAEDTTAPYSVVWNTTTASEGAHTLTAVARDAVPNSTTSSPVTVTVDNIGFVAKFDIGDRVQVNNSIITVRTTPTEGGSPGTSLGTQPVGGQGVVLAGPITASNGATYWQINYDTGVDGWSAEQFLDEVSGPVNTPPTVSLTAPAVGSTVSGLVSVSAAASDPDGGVLGVQFSLDGGVGLGAEDTTSPYSVVWDSTLTSNGPHQLGAVARDTSGATSTRAVRIVNVNNADVCP